MCQMKETEAVVTFMYPTKYFYLADYMKNYTFNILCIILV